MFDAKPKQTYTLERLTWAQAREALLPVQPDLVAVIDDLQPGKAFYLYRLQYRYGDLIQRGGMLQLPLANGSGTVPLDEADVPAALKEDLFLGHMPMAVITKGAVEQEVFEPEVCPWGLRLAGDILALWSVLDKGVSFHPLTIWRLYAGAKSLVMLPPIGDKLAHARLVKYFACKLPCPTTLADQWQVFRQLANHPTFDSPWSAELLVFPKPWLAQRDDVAWAPFYLYLYDYAWQRTNFWRNKGFFDGLYSMVQAKRNLRPNPQLADIAKYLLAMASGAAQGFVFARGDSVAPVSGLQAIYREIFQLKQYAPLMIHLSALDKKSLSPIYYSLRYRLYHELAPKPKSGYSVMQELRELKHILTTTVDEVLRANYGLIGPFFNEFYHRTRFAFWHNEVDTGGDIQHTAGLLQADNSLANALKEAGGGEFCSSATFLRGSVTITQTLNEKLKSG